ncbi:PAS domain-containing protein, partial [Escherichia coli]|uniref:PAS domain-containing protein n=1 Tax=Escherichia coli TaxID=562 RepID=UPI0019325CCC
EMADALNHGSGEHEGWRVRKSGEWFWASGQMSPLRDETGDVIGYVKIVRDRTLERQAAEALAASQEQLRIAHTAGGIGSFAI